MTSASSHVGYVPEKVSLPPIRPGDIGLGNPFSVVCESIEALRPLGDSELLLGCDNNLPKRAATRVWPTTTSSSS
jgi:hypothetical protein